MQTVTP